MRFRPTEIRFDNKTHGEELHSYLLQFSEREQVHMTPEMKPILDLIISCVIVKKGWLDPRDGNRDCDDLVQHSYASSNRILQNLWTRLNTPDNPVKSTYSYLFKAYENKMRDYIRALSDDTEPFEFIEDLSDSVQVSQRFPQESCYGRFENIYTKIQYDEIREYTQERLEKYPIRLKGEDRVAFYWLVDCFLRDHVVTEYDLWPWSAQFSLEKREFIFDYFETIKNLILYPHKGIHRKLMLRPPKHN